MDSSIKVNKRRFAASILLISLVFLALTSIVAVVQAKTGGILWVDGQEVGKEFYVAFGEWYLIEVRDLPCDFTVGEKVEVNIAEDGWTREVTVQGTAGDKYIGPMNWFCDIELLDYCNTYTVKYRAFDGDPSGTYVAQGMVGGEIIPGGGHLHAIPEFTFGSVMAVLSLFSGLGLYSKFKRK